MRKHLMTTALAAFMATAAVAGGAEAYEHWHGGYNHGGYGHPGYWQGGRGYYYPHGYSRGAVVIGAYQPYPYYSPYYPGAYPVAPPPVVYAPPPGISLGLSLR